ncbi:MAG: ATP-binding cassette domain-containing protein [Bacteroidia bacterium]
MQHMLLQMQNIIKEFSGVRALNGVSFTVEQGEIHALCGENGAGKSTLMKVLSGVYPFGSYSGEIIFDGELQRFKTISDSEHKGISIIAQELALVPEMSVAENIFLGREIKKNGVIDWSATNAEAAKLIARLGINVSTKSLIKNLGVGMQQMVEIAKALSKQARLLILDEPTAALTEKESEVLLRILLDLKAQGLTSIIISHKLKEVLSIADNITVLRDGSSVGSLTSKEANENALVKLMVGRQMNDLFNKQKLVRGEKILEVENLTSYTEINKDKKVIDDASIEVYKSEIVGIAGLMGAGRTELIQAVFGVWKGKVKGAIKLMGKTVLHKSPLQAIQNGFALVSEDRKKYGLILPETIIKNISLAWLRNMSRNGLIQKILEKKEAQRFKEELKIKAYSIKQAVGNLSGGNQQKVVLAKWLLTNPKVLILDEPTRGIDIGAKEEIYTLIQKLAQQGAAILMVSSELPELLGICDRIYVMHEGKIETCLNREEATQEKIMHFAAGLG